MSVATHLGLGDPDNDVLSVARERWSSWRAVHEDLRVVDDLLDLPQWLRGADWGDADRVLLALAQLSSPDGGDDVAATGALLWLLLPGASLLAHRLNSLTGRIDELLAAQLWLEARTFPWRRGRKVAANILMNARKGVMRDVGVGDAADTTWARSTPRPPSADLWLEIAQRGHDTEPTAGEDLADVLDRACAQQVITSADRDLLVGLAEAADLAATTRSGRGHAGLMASAASEAVAAQAGVSARTVRRRALRSVQALRSACAVDSKISASPGPPAARGGHWASR